MLKKFLLLCSIFTVLFVVYYFFYKVPRPQEEIAILIGDSYNENDPSIKIWTQTAKEEGMLLTIIKASSILKSPYLNGIDIDSFKGVIIPDSLHKKAGDPIIKRLHQYVKNGGKLMVVFDAMVYENTGEFGIDFFYKDQSPLSSLVGFKYALYDKHKVNTVVLQNILGEPKNFEMFQIPPGKYKYRDGNFRIATYGYESAQYPVFKTDISQKSSSLTVLLKSNNNSVVSSLNKFGQGQVFFVNLPLTYLKARTDGVFLNGFLYYFAHDIVKVPMLVRTPDAKGIGIMNLHVDSNAATKPLQILEKNGFFKMGKYSIHITAGPDAHQLNDGLGLDVENNEIIKTMIRKWLSQGHEIGNHGGWNHDYFARNVNEKNADVFTTFVEKNNNVLSKVAGRKLTEYSSPSGNQPLWLIKWLIDHDFKCYYFTGNIGMAPTRSFREGNLVDEKIWSFPVLTYGKVGTFEEAKQQDKSEEEISLWLNNIIRFNVEQKTTRLIYFHPPGMMYYLNTLNNLISVVNDYQKNNLFEWKTMSEYTDFLNHRENTQWTYKANGSSVDIILKNSSGLQEIVLDVPASDYEIIDVGENTLKKNSKNYFIHLKNKQAHIRLKKKD